VSWAEGYSGYSAPGALGTERNMLLVDHKKESNGNMKSNCGRKIDTRIQILNSLDPVNAKA
jgi:hypothetical protein